MANSNKKISIKEVALLSGVSIATVSRIINNNGRFSEETRRKVFDVIEKYGYTTNMAAKSLRQSKSHSIGIIVPDISNEFFSRIALEVENFFYEKGYSVFICNSTNNPEKEKNYFKSLDSKLVDGILCISGQKNIPADIITREIPVICIDRYPDHEKNISVVSSDGVAGGYIATDLLLTKGCKNILALVSNTGAYDRFNRLTGYEDALLKNKIFLDKDKIKYLKGGMPSSIEAELIVDNCIKEGLKFDGIFAVSDRTAYGALVSLKKHNIKIPEEVKLVGFDDSSFSKLTSPSITTIHQDTTLLAQTASDMLYKMITTNIKQSNDIVILPVKLIERETT